MVSEHVNLVDLILFSSDLVFLLLYLWDTVVVSEPSVTSPRLNRINSILIPPSCNFFSGSPPANNSGVKRAWPGAIPGWLTDRELFPGAQSEDKSAQKRLGLVCRARL
jgi:hypothetical protein